MSFTRTLFSSLGATLAQGISSAAAAQQGRSPQPLPARKKAPGCTPCAARAMVAAAKGARPGR